MRVKYEVDKDKMCKFLDYLYTTDKSSIDEYTLVVLGYIIDNNLVNYSFDVLGDLTKGEDNYNPIIPAIRDLNKFYLDLPPKAPLTEKSTRWLKIGIDFMLTNCKEYMAIEILKKKIVYKEENKVFREYIIDNKEEFPDIYLDLLL